jgi:hypothetical protein
MPLQQGSTTRDGKRAGYYRWGANGKMYTYPPGDADRRGRARRKAKAQGRAIEASKRRS